MNKITVLTNNDSPNSRAFNFPLLHSSKYLKSIGYKVKFVFNIKNISEDTNILFINSKVLKHYWSDNEDFIFNLLTRIASRNIEIFWFDISDSTWSTQFKVLPYVKKYFKNQVFKDKNLYLKKFNTGRIFTDYFKELYDSNEQETDYFIPEESLLHKIDISWNTCFENYTKYRNNKFNKYYNRLRPFLGKDWVKKINVDFVNPKNERTIALSNRVSLNHTRTSIVTHRKAINHIVSKFNSDNTVVSLQAYFDELALSKVAVGPFGLGEITLRDFEIIICGATLLKPSMGHMLTWPNLFVANNTYVPFNWDLNDLNQKIDFYLKEKEQREQIAINAQNLYKHILSENGMVEFANRLIKLIN